MKTIKLIFKLIWIVLILYITAFILLNIFAKDKTTKILGINTYNVSTKSMEPKYQVNDIIIVKKTNFEKLEVGDVITFKTKVKVNKQILEISVTHYVGLIEKEDNITKIKTQTYNNYHAKNNKYDVWYNSLGEEILYVYEDQLTGVVIASIPNLGRVVNKSTSLIKQPMFYVFMGGFVLIITLIVHVYESSKVNNSKDNEEEIE